MYCVNKVSVAVLNCEDKKNSIFTGEAKRLFYSNSFPMHENNISLFLHTDTILLRSILNRKTILFVNLDIGQRYMLRSNINLTNWVNVKVELL